LSRRASSRLIFLSTTTGRFSGEIEGLTGNLFSGDDSFRGLRDGSEDFCGDADLGSGELRIFNGFNGEVCSRSTELCAAGRGVLLGEMFSLLLKFVTSAANGELGGPSLSVSVIACVVKLVTS
jgi:hypothetical protein